MFDIIPAANECREPLSQRKKLIIKIKRPRQMDGNGDEGKGDAVEKSVTLVKII
jgi:hypothetical protein